MPSHPHDDHETSRSRRALHAMRSQIQPGSFPLLLAAIGTLYVLNGLAASSELAEGLLLAAHVAVLVASIYALSARRETLAVAVMMGVVALAFELRVLGVGYVPHRLGEDVVSIAFLLWILVVVLREVVRPTTAERDAVLGALCGFLMILTIFTRVHALLEVLVPGSYQGVALGGVPARPGVVLSTFQYFSTVTLTTTGFGDIVPVSVPARLVTGLEAIVGQLYLAVVVASLVGRAVGRRGQ
ncbi:MAG: two pore domain potassium channel family protein [bacterium]|nr:two pore domain potassium channel family protein [bacterium]